MGRSRKTSKSRGAATQSPRKHAGASAGARLQGRLAVDEVAALVDCVGKQAAKQARSARVGQGGKFDSDTISWTVSDVALLPTHLRAK